MAPSDSDWTPALSRRPRDASTPQLRHPRRRPADQPARAGRPGPPGRRRPGGQGGRAHQLDADQRGQLLAWLSARNNQGAWAAYEFNWSTDYCSSSPDNPLGFNFQLSCARHDFGYRNYKAVGQFSSNKSRLDSAFYEDLKRKCATYYSIVRPACYSLAWTYYQAVRAFGSVITTQRDLDRARALLPAGAVVAAA